ncbi:MAG TPA: trigger factor [Gemmatimonas aurantiaca]|uniref:Trigger factor n=2 Tax=Gemmatimonas aurantiaca TaxID=173480 RepID=C1AB45_GEMAT|nr:trigger factor [Gemmatimonas aurantiaca]BAH39451.1 trigger factor [Gemmatimonas aurantiaca T-27]HCT58539.1 trigger factor [Gemmatimonas aurantiaca]
MNISITPTETAGVSRRLQITVPADTVASYEDQAARKYATQVRLPGFRPGKAPPSMVRKRFPEAVRQEAIELVINDAFREAIDREGFKLAAQPHIHDLKSEPGQPLEFELHCEVRPELALEKVDGFTITRRDTTVTEELIDEQIERLREQKADWSPVEEKPAPGDMVTVILSTEETDGILPEGKEYRIVLGGGQAIPGIEELIMETAPGASSEKSVRWPEDFPDESQRGATKLVRVQLKDVKRKALPALDDAFAREIGDFDTVQVLRDAVRTDMGEHSKREADADVRGQLIEQIVTANPFDVPKAWVMQLVDGYMQMYGVPENQKQTFTQEFMPMAERQVRRDLIVDTLAERESLTASAADVDARVEELAKARNADPGQVYAQLQKAGRLTEVERELTEDRVFGWLLEKNPVTAA